MLWDTFLLFFYPIGMGFLIGVGVWTIVTINRVKLEQASAILLLKLLAERAGLKVAIDHIQATMLSEEQ